LNSGISNQLDGSEDIHCKYLLQLHNKSTELAIEEAKAFCVVNKEEKIFFYDFYNEDAEDSFQMHREASSIEAEIEQK